MPEPMEWNQVKTLLESQEKKISLIADGIADIHPRIVRVEKKVDGVVEDVRLLRDAVQGLGRDMKEVKDRLAVAELKLPA